MHSRLYRRVLNKHGWVSNATAFSTLYNDSGVAGIHITSDSRQIDHAVDIAVEELQATPPPPRGRGMCALARLAVSGRLYQRSPHGDVSVGMPDDTEVCILFRDHIQPSQKLRRPEMRCRQCSSR